MSARLSQGFVFLQLSMVDRFVAIGAGSWADGAHRLTNLQRRLGLGTPTDPPSNPAWVELFATLAAFDSINERVDVVMDAASSLPPAVPEHIANGWPTVGAFSIEVAGTVARTHFYSMDEDDESPLHPRKLAKRREELTAVVSTVGADHPEVEFIAGGSWLYSTRSYASLFPPTHLAGAVVRRGRSTFRGMSHWGQFVDHRGDVRADLAAHFLGRVGTWAGDDPCRLFPIETLEVRSPISHFLAR